MAGGRWRLTDGFTGSGVLTGVKASLAVGAAHALAGEVEAVGVVNEAVEDGVGEGRIADDVAPLIDRDLAGDEGGAPSVAVLEDLEQVDALRLGEDLQSPVVEDEQMG